MVGRRLTNVVAGELGGLEESDLEALIGEGRGCIAAGRATANEDL